MRDKVNIFWFRRDLRLNDNVGLYQALHGKFPVLPIFIFDSEILGELPKKDPRVTFISETLQNIRAKLLDLGSSLAVYHGKPKEILQNIIANFDVQNVIANHDYEPYATKRDSEIKSILSEQNIGFYTFKDQVIFERDEIVKMDGKPYVVYTPYMKVWKEKFSSIYKEKDYDISTSSGAFYQNVALPYLTLADIGFERSEIAVPKFSLSAEKIEDYEQKRNFPSKNGTSHLGPHLRFGTVSIRKIVKMASAQKSEVFLQELIWREFFMQILWHFPETVQNAFKKKYDRIEWRNNGEDFDKWKIGKTGYPIIDAGMRQLNATGYMHNRVRMVVASFLCKHLLIDWRWGEAYFAEKLLDYEMANNVGNWQWAAGSGVDAAPYFRIFNPIAQQEKFDKDFVYIKRWIPEFGTAQYPDKIVEHTVARARCLEVYKKALT